MVSSKEDVDAIVGMFDKVGAPKRAAHPKGAGAHGYFEVTNDISNYCCADIFDGIGKKTALFVRFSMAGGAIGNPDTVRNFRGFAIKFKTEEGDWDLAANNTPLFWISDPKYFLDFARSNRKNPQSNLPDKNYAFQFHAEHPESLHQLLLLNSDGGIPDGYRHMDGFGTHAYKMVNKDGVAVYCKFHIKTCQGIRNLTNERAAELAAKDGDYFTRDLFTSIQEGHFPEWKFEVQIMTMNEADKCDFDPFDATKIWPTSLFPRIEVGKLVLNRNPENYNLEVEQAMFCPSSLVEGIELSPDPILQTRAAVYARVQRYRRNKGDETEGHGSIEEMTVPHRIERANNSPYLQPGNFYRKVLDESAKERLVQNLAGGLKACAVELQKTMVDEFKKVDTGLGERIEAKLSA